MTKLNEKPLSQMLEEIEPQLHDCCDKDGRHVLTTADYNDYQKLKAVVMELAKWIEQETSCQRLSFRHVRPCSRCDALSRAKDIIGEVKNE